jgi:ribosome recycling factor
MVPGSKQALTSEASRLEYGKAETKMSAAVEWYRKEVAGLETRASGRVTPALLSPVRIELPGKEKGKDFGKLEDVATVGVREGSTLVVTVFEEHVSGPPRSSWLGFVFMAFAYWCTSRI